MGSKIIKGETKENQKEIKQKVIDLKVAKKTINDGLIHKDNKFITIEKGKKEKGLENIHSNKLDKKIEVHKDETKHTTVYSKKEDSKNKETNKNETIKGNIHTKEQENKNVKSDVAKSEHEKENKDNSQNGKTKSSDSTISEALKKKAES